MTGEQQKLFELLETFSDFCDRYNLRYNISGGTLLGAVRHQGFIPWDDDIDVMMPIADFKRFLALEKNLPAGLHIQSDRTDVNYPFLFVELCDMRTTFKTKNRHGPMGIYMDIFPIVPARKPTRWVESCFNVVCVIDYVLQVKCGWTSFCPYKKKLARAGFCVLKWLPKRALRALRRMLLRELSSDGTEYCFSPGGGHKGTEEFYEKRWLAQTTYLCFEGKPFPAPSGWDAYLRCLYGEYMVLPPEAERKSAHKGEK